MKPYIFWWSLAILLAIVLSPLIFLLAVVELIGMAFGKDILMLRGDDYWVSPDGF